MKPLQLATDADRCSTIELPEGDDPAAFAGRLLATPAVRSVVIDTAARKAVVHLRHGSDRDADGSDELQSVADIAARNQRALQSAAGRLKAVDIACSIDRATGAQSYFRLPPLATGVKRLTLLLTGTLMVGLAHIVRRLPFVSSAPITLIASMFLTRSAPDWRRRLVRSSTTSEMLHEWHTKQAVAPRLKRATFALLAIVTAATLPLVWHSMTAAATLLLVAAAVAGGIDRLRTI